MSETTPDPADVHTGTDRVELTDAEREALLFGFGIRFYENADHTRFSQGVAAVESIVAARLQALADERDRLRVDTNINADEVERQRGLLDLARAELAAANARCAELERDCTDLRELADASGMVESRAIVRAVARERERDALQATLDRVVALADEWEASAARTQTEIDTWATDYEKPLFAEHRDALLRRVADLRAALTPEGKPEGGCGVCLTCDPPQDDPRFGFPLMQRMYVCGTCGNKRCPAAGDCLKWECSGSNATNQVPVPRTPEGTE